MLVYIDDREDEELDDCDNEESSDSYGYDYGDEEESYDYSESDDRNFLWWFFMLKENI